METNNNDNDFKWDNEDDLFLNGNPFEQEKDQQKKDDLKDKEKNPDNDQDDPFDDIKYDEEDNNPEDKDKKSDDEGDDDGDDDEKVSIFERTGISKDIFEYAEIEDENAEDLDINDIIYDESQGRFESYVKNFASKFDDTAKNFFNFLKEGGNSQEFFDTFRQNSFDFDVEKASPKEIIKNALSKFAPDLSSEEIDERIDIYEDKGVLEKKAESYKDKIKEYQDNLANEILRQQEDAIAEIKRKESEAANIINEYINNNTVIENSIIPITPVDRKKLGKYISEKNIPYGNGVNISQFQKDMSEVLSTTEGAIAFAKLTQMIKKGYDFSQIVNKIETNKNNKKEKSNNKKPKRSTNDEFDFSNYLN